MSFVLKLVLGIFLFPGKIILWNRYISAPKGRVLISRRQLVDIPCQIFFSILGWGLIFNIALSYFSGDVEKGKVDQVESVERTDDSIKKENKITYERNSQLRDQVF